MKRNINCSGAKKKNLTLKTVRKRFCYNNMRIYENMIVIDRFK